MPQPVMTVKLGQLLVQEGRITPAQLAEAMTIQSSTTRALGDVLRELGYVSDDDLSRALAQQVGVPFLDLGEDFHLSRDDVALLPETIARRHVLFAMRAPGDPCVTAVMRDPLDLDALDTVRSLTRSDVRKAISSEQRILQVIDRFYREDAHIEQNLRDLANGGAAGIEAAADADAPVNSEQLRVLANDAPVVRFVNLLLMNAVRDGASDIHFEPAEKTVTVRLRVDGYLREVTPPPPKSLYPAVVTRIKILSNMDIAERRLPLDGRFKFAVADRLIDVRVSSLPEVFGEKLVLRILDRAGRVETLEGIGFEPDIVRRFKRILNLPHGIVLLTGPTGSGKTTTLYAALTHLRSPTINIQTVEDPVEYLVPGINQMQVKEKIGLDFASSLRSILRQDPDVIMIGEIRDLETARMAMRSALTGHLVLSTLHTNDSVSAFSRLRDVGIESYLVAATVNLVISQRLVRRLCTQCKEPVDALPEHLSWLEGLCPGAGTWTYYRGRGCEHCGHTGYKGRVGLVEFLEVSDAIRALVQERQGDIAVKAKALEEGLKTLAMDGMEKVRQGITSVEELVGITMPGDMGPSPR